MKLSIYKEGACLEFDLRKAYDISIPIQRADSVSSFRIAGAKYEDYRDGDFIGNKQKGGSCNLETISFTAHGNGTHTECYGHIANDIKYVNDCVIDQFYLAKVVSVGSKLQGKGLYLDFSDFYFNAIGPVEALVIRSLPNSKGKVHTDYSGVLTPSILPEDMEKIVKAGIRHLLVDLPSVDPEWDGGVLASHHVFWNYPTATRTDASITEFIYLHDRIEDGLYALKLNIANFISDAAPSKPTLYPLA